MRIWRRRFGSAVLFFVVVFVLEGLGGGVGLWMSGGWGGDERGMVMNRLEKDFRLETELVHENDYGERGKLHAYVHLEGMAFECVLLWALQVHVHGDYPM